MNCLGQVDTNHLYLFNINASELCAIVPNSPSVWVLYWPSINQQTSTSALLQWFWSSNVCGHFLASVEMSISKSSFYGADFSSYLLCIQGVETIWLEKGLFWLETNKMAEKTSNIHTGKCILCYCRCFIEMCALIP